MNEHTRTIVKEHIKTLYRNRSYILRNIIKHINALKNDSIIQQQLCTEYIQYVGDTIDALNERYNVLIDTYKTEKITRITTHCYKTFNMEMTLKMLSRGYDYVHNTNDISNNDRFMYRMFDKVDVMIMDIIRNIGLYSINDMFYMLIGNDYRTLLSIDNDVNELKEYVYAERNDISLKNIQRKMSKSLALVDILGREFHPISLEVSNSTSPKSKVTIKRSNEENYKGDADIKVLVDNCYDVTIQTQYVVLNVTGYFDNDPINSLLQTSQICDVHIHQKKKLLVAYIKKHANNILIEYCEKFFINLKLGDILSCTGPEIMERLIDSYKTYIYISNMKHIDRNNEFRKSNLLDKYSIIKCLLNGPRGSVKHGAMIYGASRDENARGTTVADIIYRNLNYTQQILLRNPNKYIEEDMKRISDMKDKINDLKQQCILNDHMPDDVKKIVLNRLDNDEKDNGAHNDPHKSRLFSETLINFPWINDNHIDDFAMVDKDEHRNRLVHIRNTLDEGSYGQSDAKNMICDIVGKWITNPASDGKCYGFHGPPGVGKTLLATNLGKALGIPTNIIKTGGLDDSSYINGFSYTYSGAQPGILVKLMVKGRNPRCFIIVDEIDKTVKRQGIDEVQNVFVHVTDPETNHEYNDKFFSDINFPLNMVTFIFTFNDKSKIDPILLDRMEIIKFKQYTMNEKVIIAQKFITPYALKEVHITDNSVIVGHSIIEYIIENYAVGSGIRSMKDAIHKLILKLNTDRIYGKGPYTHGDKATKKNPIRISKTLLLKYLGDTTIEHDQIHNKDTVGIINGLYATEYGIGGILPILVYKTVENNNDKFELKLTGKQGDTMTESVNFAWTIAKNTVKYDYVKKFYDNSKGGLHIHALDGATPKNGPSAGSAFTIAFVSRIMNMKIKRNIAMTGEINIDGAVSKIGKLEQKIVGAKNAGVEMVFVSMENFKDVEEVVHGHNGMFKVFNPYNYDAHIVLYPNARKRKTKVTIMMIKSIHDIIPYALIDDEYVKNNYDDGYGVLDKTCDITEFMSDF